jgi:hypothetical protein
MSNLDTRLHDALSARTATLPVPAEPDWDSRPPRYKWPMAVAALLVLAVVAASSLIRPGQEQDPSLAPTVPVLPVHPAASPTRLLRMTNSTAEVEEVATGRVLGAARLPAGYSMFSLVAGFAADDHTFFAAVQAGLDGRPRIAEYHLDDQDRIGPPRLVAQAAAGRELGQIAVSPDATHLALSSDRTHPITPGNASKAPDSRRPGQIAVWDLTTGTSHTFTAPALVSSLAWSADGRRINWSTDQGSGALDPLASGNPLHYRRSGPTGGQVIANGDVLDIQTTGDQVKLVRRPAGGGASRVLDQWTDSFGMLEDPVVDCTGRYVLYVRDGTRVRLDMKTSRRALTPLKAVKGDDYSYRL